MWGRQWSWLAPTPARPLCWGWASAAISSCAPCWRKRPCARLTSLTLRHRDVALLRRGVTELAARLRVRFGRRVLGPMTPPVDRIRGEYLAGLLLKIESGASSAKARALLAAELKAFAENPEFKTITFICNVDPQ